MISARMKKKIHYFKLVTEALSFSIHFLVLKYLVTAMIALKCQPPASTSIALVQESQCSVSV